MRTPGIHLVWIVVGCAERLPMPAAYIPVLIFALLVLSFPFSHLIVFKFIRPESRGGPAKFQPYECGIPPETNARGRYSARFYIVAMLFVIFDVETLFLFPWAILFKSWIATHMGSVCAGFHVCFPGNPAGWVRVAV